ncbi:MAG: YidC/Oxa1 family membrane protein insertase [Oscillospiraceae bacterium]|nr:YidC/Oxa1 family membrane protein insertase [Oscillospiraceae bacterium]
MHYVLIPFAWLLRMLYHLFNNYGVALILFSLITKLILLPFTAKSKKSMMKTSRLGPKLKELEAKCGDDKMKYQQEMQALYKKEGVSPMSGCLWSLLPLVLLMALYYVIRQPMTYLMQLSADQITQIQDYMTSSGLVELATSGRGSYYTEIVLAQAVYDNMDAIKSIVPDIASRAIDFHFLGVDLSQIPTWRWMFDGPYTLVGFGLFIIPVISAVSQFASMQISQKLNGSVATNDKGEKDQDAAAAAAQSMKTMMYVMPLFSLWIGFSMPAAMCIYWIAQAVFNTALDGVLTVHYKKVYDEEDEIKRERAAEEAAIEAEKEARRAERRAMMPEGANPNTSRRKIKKQQKLAEADTPEGKFTEEERAEYHRQQEEKEKAKGGLSGDPNRPYSRGRAYDPNRYENAGAVQEAPAEPEPETPEDPTDPE